MSGGEVPSPCLVGGSPSPRSGGGPVSGARSDGGSPVQSQVCGGRGGAVPCCSVLSSMVDPLWTDTQSKNITFPHLRVWAVQ